MKEGQPKIEKNKRTRKLLFAIWAGLLVAIVCSSLLLKIKQSWLLVAFFFVLIPGFVSMLFCYFKDMLEEQEKPIGKLVYNWVSYIVIYWMIEAFFISIFARWLIGQFVFGGIVLVVTLLGVVTIFLSETFRQKGFLIHDFIATIAMTAYLIYIIPDPSLQNVVLILVSSIYGGFITLTGVAWTIKESQRRTEDTKRLEVMPYLQASFCDYVLGKPGESRLPDLWLNVEKHETENYPCGAAGLEIKNIGVGFASDIYCLWESKGVIENNHKHLSVSLLQCGESCQNNMMLSGAFPNDKSHDVKSVLTIFFKDRLGNRYFQKFEISSTVAEHYVKPFYLKTYDPEHIRA